MNGKVMNIKNAKSFETVVTVLKSFLCDFLGAVFFLGMEIV